MVRETQKADSGLTVWQPFREMAEMGRNFENFFGRSFLPGTWKQLLSEDMAWAPAIDVSEKDDKFLVKVELPGVKEEDINVSVSGNTLTIEGEKKSESETKKKGYYYSEASYGSFSRSMTVPSSVDLNKIDANYDKGVLEITLPKLVEVKPQKISVAAKKKSAESTAKKSSAVTGKKAAATTRKKAAPAETK